LFSVRAGPRHAHHSDLEKHSSIFGDIG